MASSNYGFRADTMIKHVFIICDKTDNEWAEKCRSMLMHPPYKLNVVTARQDFVGGKTVQSNYNALMACSNKILLVLTPDFLTNVWTPYLVSNIDTHLHRVVPIMIQKCDIPDELKDKVCIDYTLSDDEFLFYKHLFNALQEEIHTSGSAFLAGDYYVDTLPPQPPPRPPNLPRINPSDETPSELPTESMDNLLYETGEDGAYESVDDVKEPYGYCTPYPTVAVDEGYMDMTKPSEVTCEDQYEEIGTARISDEVGQTLKDEMLTKEYFLSDAQKFIQQFSRTKGQMRTKAESFLISTVLDSTCDTPVLGGDLKLLALLAHCDSSLVVRKALDSLLSEIFLSIGDATQSHSVLAAEQVLRESFATIFMEEHHKAKTQRMTTYGWLLSLVLFQWNELDCHNVQLEEIGKFDRTLDRLQRNRDFKERNLFRYGVVMARESIRRITAKRRAARDLAKHHLRKCESILNSVMESREILNLGSEMDENSWLDLHICLVHLQELPKLHQFKDNPKPIILLQKLITDFRVRHTARLKRRLVPANSRVDWKFELLVYRVLLKLLREMTCTAIVKQLTFGSEGSNGIADYWEPDYGLIRSPFALECLRKLCRKAIFVSDPDVRRYFVPLMVDEDEPVVDAGLSMNHLNSLYRKQALQVFISNTQNRAGKYSFTVYDAIMGGEKCSLKMYHHSRDQLLEILPYPDDLSSFRHEIEVLKHLNESTSCRNIVRILASGTGLLMHMVIEKATRGTLSDYLQSIKKNPTPASELKHISLDVCNAMIFLGEQGIVHRDLRAACVFVFDGEEGVVSKLGDFHLSQGLNRTPRNPCKDNRQSIIVPPDDPSFSRLFSIRWMAVESLRVGEFSTASDVWSFGVLLFEIFTLGCIPYLKMPNGRSLDDDNVREFVLDGHRLDLYLSIPIQIKLIIESSWIENSKERPTFEELKSRLEDIDFKQEKCVHPDTDGIPHRNNSDSGVGMPAKTVCPVKGCSGDCLKASDKPVVFNQLEIYYTREILSLECSSHVQRLSSLNHSAIATIEAINTHIENLELVTHYGDMGNLVEFITKYGCSMENAMSFITKIAQAITFMHNRRFIHCDIRAESVSVYTNGDVKLGRLGRAKSLKAGPYGDSQRALIELQMPTDSIKWSSIEVIKNGIYSEGSDVWAFGMLMWQMFTLMDIDKKKEEIRTSSVPYEFLSNKQIYPYLEMGSRLFKPDCCPYWLFIVVEQCWLYNRLERPSMAAILDCLTHRRPFDSYLLKKWLRRQNNHLYENWPDANVEQDENFDHVLPAQDHFTEDNLDSLSNDEFIGENNYDTVEPELLQRQQTIVKSRKKPMPRPRSYMYNKYK